MTLQTRDLAALERELEELKKQLPRHSISPSILARIDELEEEIDALKEGESTRTHENVRSSL